MRIILLALLAGQPAYAQDFTLGLSYGQPIDAALALLTRAAQPGSLREVTAQREPLPAPASLAPVERHITATAQVNGITSIVSGYFVQNRLSVLVVETLPQAAAQAMYGPKRHLEYSEFLGKIGMTAKQIHRRLVGALGTPRAVATVAAEPDHYVQECYAGGKTLVTLQFYAPRLEGGLPAPTKGYSMVYHSLDNLAAFDLRWPAPWHYPPPSPACDAALHTN